MRVIINYGMVVEYSKKLRFSIEDVMFVVSSK